jgi:hypothetical protein
MAKDEIRNLPASVRQRLLNLAKKRGDAFDLVLVRYALERLLYRISVSRYAEQFLLKGALLFAVWGQDEHRPTRDADLLGSGPGEPERVQSVFKEFCGIRYEDGIMFDTNSVKVEEIAEDKIYPGLRVTLNAELAGARIPVQVDVGFGDAVVPGAETVRYPTMLEFPAPQLRAYPVYTVISEKFQAMVALGGANSRMKDFYDLWAIGRRFELDGGTLSRAIEATFARRKTTLPDGKPVALKPEFAEIPGKAAQWSAFVRRNRLNAAEISLSKAQASIAALVLDPVTALRDGKPFDQTWKPGGPWKDTK